MALTVGTAAITLGVVLLVWYLSRTLRRKERNYPPGPPGWPLFGNLFTLLFSKRHQHEIIDEWSKRYGPIFSLNLLGTRIYITSDMTLIQEAFQHNTNISDRLPLGAVSEELDNFNSGVGFSNGKVWKEQRRFFMSCFSRLEGGDIRLQEIVQTQTKRFVEMIAEHNGENFNPFELTNLTIASIVTRIVTGLWFGRHDASFLQLNKSINRMFKLMGPAGIMSCIPAVSAFPSRAKTEIKSIFKEIVDFIDKAIELHKAEVDPEKPTDDFIGCYLKVMAEMASKGNASSHSFDMTNLRSCCVDSLAAGWESVTGTLLWVFFTLSQHPDTQRKMRQEINDATSGCRTPTYNDRHSMPFTEAAIAECMRINPIVPLTLPHIASSDCVLGGYDVPRGTTVIGNTWYLGRKPELWDDPEQFNPNRLLDDDGNFIRRPELIIFSYGRRSCPGENLARMEIFVIVTHVLQKFELRLSEDSAKSSRGIRLSGFTVRPEPYEISATAVTK